MKTETKEIICISIALVVIICTIFLMTTGRMQEAVDECLEIFGNESMACKTALSDPHASLSFSLFEGLERFENQRQQCIKECSEINKEKGVAVCLC